MAIAVLLNSITPQLKTLRPEAAVFVGAEYLADNSAIAPRVVWVPTTSQASGAEAHQVTYPRSLATRVTNVDAHLWGKGEGDTSDFDACEDLLQALVQAMRATLTAAYQYLGDRWPERDGSAPTQYGRELIASFSFSTPIADSTGAEQVVTLTPTPATLTGEMDFLDGLVVSGSPAP